MLTDTYSKRNIIAITSIYTIVAIVVFLLSYNTPWMGDDVTYQFNFATGKPIESISDIFQSQYVHYFTWNGRYVAHWLCQLFLPILGKTTFSVCNAIVSTALVAMVVKVSGATLKNVKSTAISAILVLLFTDTVYTPTHQIGYIWMSVIVLIFIYLFLGYYRNTEFKTIQAIPLFVGAIIAGNSHESINIGVGGALAIYFFVHLHRLTAYQWTMIMGFAVGALFLCLSPAALGNAEGRGVPFMYSILTLVTSLRVTYVFIFLLIYCKLSHRLTLRRFYIENAFYVNAMIISFIFCCLIGISVNRQLWGVELFACILSVKLLGNIRILPLVSALATLILVCIYTLKFQEIFKMKRAYAILINELKGHNTAEPIFVDFPQQNLLIHPTSYLKYGWYLDYALSSAYIIANDIEDQTDYKILAYPTHLKDTFKGRIKNQVYEYLPGEFILMQDKKNPAKFLLDRNIAISGLCVSLPSSEITFDTESELNTEDYNIIIIPKTMPLIDNVSVSVE